jgi:D-glycero-alpha-D-manno-heptose 1-phosphate guanylyltransferase
MPATITALILAGGLGTRLRASVTDRPKVLAEVAGRPFINFILHQLQKFGIHRVLMCTGYMGDQVEALLGNSYGTLEINYSREKSPLGTGGALRLAAEKITDGDLLVLNGDSYCDFSFEPFLQFHREKGSKASILLTKVEDCARYGAVTIDSNHRIQSFIEKGQLKGAGLINAGAYLLSAEMLLTIPVKQQVSLESEIFPVWVSRGIFGYTANAVRFIDIGTPESYRLAQEFF